MNTNSTSKPSVSLAFVIGRFQPFHNGHKHLVDFGLEHAKKVVVLVGGSNKARSVKNPWTYKERASMINSAMFHAIDDDPWTEKRTPRVIVEPLPDVPGNDDAWLGNVYERVNKWLGKNHTLGIVGFKKDMSSYYLDLFPDAEQILLEEGYGTLNATNLREAYFQDAPIFPEHLVPEPVFKHLLDFYKTPDFKYILDEKKWLDAYKESWAGSPFPPQFITADCLAIQMGHVLLVTRGDFPGKGQLALPGGFVEAQKGDSFENALYELWEEAGIQDERGRIPRGKLRGFYTGQEKRFDDPSRSIRGFTLTTAFKFKFPDGKEFFKVKGGDDAIDAKWYPINWVTKNPEKLFEDHYHIIMNMLSTS